MCVLQDFEAITPNLLARTIETVEGGGLVVLLLKTMTSLKQLYTMTMVGSTLTPIYPQSKLTSLYLGRSRPLSNISARFCRCTLQ
jgi:tRNA(Met) C34 N-acetyltransferase TmcA